MLETPLPQGQIVSRQGASPRVYCLEVAPLRLADGTPLYLEWIIEGEGGTLYRVPAEPRGWFRRSPYQGEASRLRPLPSREANAIARFTCAEWTGQAAVGYSSGHCHL